MKLEFIRTPEGKHESEFVSESINILQFECIEKGVGSLQIYCRIESSFDWYLLKTIQHTPQKFVLPIMIPRGIQVRVVLDTEDCSVELIHEQENKEELSNPPDGALVDDDGFLLLDINNYFITSEENGAT